MRKKFDFQLFEDGSGSSQGTSGSQGGDAGSGNGNHQNAGTYSFQQAEEIANARAERASKAALKSYFQQQGMNEEEVEQALKDYKTKKAQQTPSVEAERDAARKELEDLKNSNLLRDKGVKTEDLDYVMFKVNQIAAEKKQDFKKVAEEYLKENPRFTGQGTYRISTSTSAASSGSAQNSNDDINAAIRRAAGR